MAFVRHGTLTADQVAIVTLPNRRLDEVEVMNVDGAAPIYFIVVAAGDSAAPTVAGNDCEVIPTAGSFSANTPAEGAGALVKMISSGTPMYSVRAE